MQRKPWKTFDSRCRRSINILVDVDRDEESIHNLKELKKMEGMPEAMTLASCGPYRGESTFLFTPCIRFFPLGRETMTRIPSGIDCPPAWKTFDVCTTYADRKYPRGCTRPRHDPVAEVRHTECKFASMQFFALREDKIDTFFRRVLWHSRC